MAESERKDRTRFRSSEIRSMLGLLVFGVVLGSVASYLSRDRPGLSNIFATGTVTLIFGSLLGGVVALLIADFDRSRVQRAAQLEFIANVLADLKTVYDRIDRGRILIAAHQSAKTYGEQMREFIDARVRLLSVLRALRFDERGSPIRGVRLEVQKMEAYVHLLTKEFEQCYKTISRLQSVYEARMRRALDNLSPSDSVPPQLPANSPWSELSELSQLKDFLSPLGDCKDESASGVSEYCSARLGTRVDPEAMGAPEPTLRRHVHESLEFVLYSQIETIRNRNGEEGALCDNGLDS